MSKIIKRLEFKDTRESIEQLNKDVEWILDHAKCNDLKSEVFISFLSKTSINFTIYQTEKTLTSYNRLRECYSDILSESSCILN